MNVGYGSASLSMYDTVIQELGPHTSIFNVGSTQVMSFTNNDDGPFWMSAEERATTKNDTWVEGSSVKEKNKASLLIELRSKGIDTTKNDI